MPARHGQGEQVDVFAFKNVFHHRAALDDARRYELLVVEAFLPGLDEFVAAVVERQVRGEALAFQRLMVHADQHAMTRRIIFDLSNKNRRVGLVARVDFGERAHFEVPIDAGIRLQLAELSRLH